MLCGWISMLPIVSVADRWSLCNIQQSLPEYSATIGNPDCYPRLPAITVGCRSSEAEMQELHVNMGSALEALFHHKLHIQQALDKVQQHVEGIKTELIAL